MRSALTKLDKLLDEITSFGIYYHNMEVYEAFSDLCAQAKKLVREMEDDL